MRSTLGFITLPFISVGVLASCASAEDPQDERAGVSTRSDALDVTADAVSDGASTYFAITADTRKCPSPLCGGWFVQRLNRPMTRCHDGSRAQTCYTPVLDWSESKLAEAQQASLLDAAARGVASGGVYAIARGRFAPTNRTTPHPEMGRFMVTEAWVAEGDGVSEGAFVKIKDNGVRCFAAPCPSMDEQMLNMPQLTTIAGLDHDAAAMTDEQLEVCYQAMASSDGLMVAGDRYMMHVNGSTAKGRTMTAAYRRLVSSTR